ncbi:zinc transport system permease protein [Kushneria sinocarnis]|uniref:Zinc transport system permease protein n=1 Tax=Kushneria sinocarnis TaxID=595502 RepID=A0A420WYG4_9GAMM|nr:metal ABC transporter permease [Kushneria sinocarnis]RKR06200.1 zinc transport system permease protein [Kushneria sinocarnis]
MNFIAALLEQPFLQQALLVGLLAGMASGLIGPYVVVKRIGYMAGGIAHTVLAGMGVAFFLGSSPMVGAFICAIIAALLIGCISLSGIDQEDTLISAFWAVGMAVGLLFISQTPGYRTDLMSLLFGNLMLSTRTMVFGLGGIVAALAIILGLIHRPLVAVIFDEEFTRLRGVPTRALYLLLLCLVAVTIVVLLQAVGLIMVIALLTLPAALAGHHVRSLVGMMVMASLMSMLFIGAGLGVAWQADLPAGATIVLLTGIGYIISLTGHRLNRLFRRRQAASGTERSHS